MVFKGRKKSGTMTLEMFFLMFSAIVVMIVALSGVYGGLNQLATNSSISKITTENPAKTSFDESAQSYENSTVEVR